MFSNYHFKSTEPIVYLKFWPRSPCAFILYYLIIFKSLTILISNIKICRSGGLDLVRFLFLKRFEFDENLIPRFRRQNKNSTTTTEAPRDRAYCITIHSREYASLHVCIIYTYSSINNESHQS
uniref:Uncharacterized protein n=1 Tax=Cacopsylla melanoneura TaxID=428564 RepID=A0A8D8Y094_9HEMI